MAQGENRVTVSFYDEAEDALLRFAVIVARAGEKYVFCKHRLRDTFEIPGGHREPGETILETARRELYEETGAVDFDICPVCVYSVVQADDPDGQESFGMLYSAQIRSFEAELHSEIERIVLTDCMPAAQTYPDIQPGLLEEVQKRGAI